MALTPHTISSAKGRKKKRVGRGNGSGTGTYSGRGLKGQKSRSGGSRGLQRLAFKQQLQKVPKLRGFTSLTAKPATVTLSTLERLCEDGTIVTKEFLKKSGAISKPQNGVKIVGTGELTKKITVRGCKLSASATEAITKAGGTIEETTATK